MMTITKKKVKDFVLGQCFTSTLDVLILNVLEIMLYLTEDVDGQKSYQLCFYSHGIEFVVGKWNLMIRIEKCRHIRVDI